jgi:hypothetical protein
MLYLLIVPIILLVVAYIGSRDLFVSKEARLVFMAGWVLISIGLAIFVSLSYSVNLPMFAIAIFSMLGLVGMGLATVETADGVEVKIRRLDRYTREPLDPFQ